MTIPVNGFSIATALTACAWAWLLTGKRMKGEGFLDFMPLIRFVGVVAFTIALWAGLLLARVSF